MALPTDNIRGWDDLCEKYKDDILNVNSGNTGIYYTSASTTVLSTGYNFCDIDLDGDNGDLADVLEILKHVDPTDQDIDPTDDNWDHFIEVLSYYDPESEQGELHKTANNGPCMSLRRIRDEYNSGATGPVSFSDYYRNGSYVTDNNTGIPATSADPIDLQDFYGTSKSFTLDILLVAGGGGAGYTSGRPGGSGGGGGVLFGTIDLEPGTYSVTVGGGGSGGGTTTAGSQGGDTTVTAYGTTYTAFGGGGGASATDAGGAGGGAAANGGSGGGGGLATNASRSGGTATQTTQGGLTGYGNNGGSAGTATAYADNAGGGGAGGPGTRNNGGGAGPGIALTIGTTQYTVAIGGGATNSNVFYVDGSSSNTTGASGTVYGRGGSTSAGSGTAGVVIIRGPAGSNHVVTASGSFTVASDGSVS